MRMMDSLVSTLFLIVIVILIVGCIVIFLYRLRAHSILGNKNNKYEKQTDELEQEVTPITEKDHKRLIGQELIKINVSREETFDGVDETQQPAEKQEPGAVEQMKNNRGDGIAPTNRGGRPRTLFEEPEKPSSQNDRHRTPKPEIICWKKERQWAVGIEIPAEFHEYHECELQQDGVGLEQDESREGCWKLKSTSGNIIIRWKENEEDNKINIVLGQEDYFLFKLSGQNQEKGRYVKSPLLGENLVITPENWNRDETLSGPPLVEPEAVIFDNYQAHFFINERSGDSKIAFLKKPTGESVIIEVKASKFELIGNRLPEIIENVGVLFGQKPPRIRGFDDQVWKDVGTIVVGEEGSGEGKWRKPFYPDPKNKEQELPSEITNRKDGWYYLRIYNTNDELLESLDFRIVSALHKVIISPSSPFPSEDGHIHAQIELHHDPNFVIKPDPEDDHAWKIQIEKNNDKTILIVPPISEYDETRWLVGSGSQQQVQASMLVERIWWAIEKVETRPSHWTDKPETLQREDFAATSSQALWLRFPRHRWVKRVLVGFDEQRAIHYPVKVTEREVNIPLRDFGDFQEMREPDCDHFLSIWIEHEKKHIQGAVAIIPATITPILCIGWGRKNRAIAAAILREGKGVIKVNKQTPDEYFVNSPLKARYFFSRLIELPDINLRLIKVDVSIKVQGSSPESIQQAKASAHALARAFMRYDPGLNPLLTQAGFGGVKVTDKFDTRTGR